MIETKPPIASIVTWLVALAPLMVWPATACSQIHKNKTTKVIEKSDATPSNMTIDGYTRKQVVGWTVWVSDELTTKHSQKTSKAIELLEQQLKKVRAVIPKSAIKKLTTVPIWFSPQYAGVRPTGEYHPNAQWLKSNGRQPKLHRCVEFTNIQIFEREVRRMPMMLLHELAHAYHHQVLGFGHKQIRAAFQESVDSGRYSAVLRSNGKTERAYAITNEKEYFAESTESYFGQNDFYPFNHGQLKKHDPVMFELVSRLWKTPQDE